jgi:hypothetical protein
MLDTTTTTIDVSAEAPNRVAADWLAIGVWAEEPFGGSA